MSKEVRTIGIVGTGIIATSMAVLTTGHGFKTVVYARSEASAQRCRNDYENHWKSLVGHGLATSEQMDICKTYLVISQDYKAMADAEIVFESALENPDVKHDIYHILEDTCPDVKAICSVSSSIVPDILAETCEKYGDRIIVTHPFNPVHMVPYFELCGGKRTAPGVIEYVYQLLEELDRKPVVLKKPTPGFIGNRLQFALWREVLALVEEGVADPRDIDRALQYSFCPRYTSIGIFEHFDNGGLELNRTTCKNLFPVISDTKTVPECIDKLIAEGKTGVKAGEGFYDWRGVDMDAYRERVNAPYWKFCEWDLPKEKM